MHERVLNTTTTTYNNNGLYCQKIKIHILFEKSRNAIIKDISVIKKNIEKVRAANTSLSSNLFACLPSTNMVTRWNTLLPFMQKSYGTS